MIDVGNDRKISDITHKALRDKRPAYSSLNTELKQENQQKKAGIRNPIKTCRAPKKHLD